MPLAGRPFIANQTEEPYDDLIVPAINDSNLCASLVESVVVTHFRRQYPIYYIKSDAEVDVAYIHNKKP